jgi:hypothetical protein
MNAAIESFPRDAYLSSGRAVLVKAKTDAGYVVEMGHEDEEGNEYFEGLKVVSKVFDAPPREKLDATIRQLLEQEKSLRDSVADLRAEKSSLESEHRKRLDYLKQFEQLRLVEDFLEGRLTHFVIAGPYEDCVSIETREEALKTDDESRRWKHELRVLALFGSHENTLQWKLSHYSDGSGHGYEVYPFTSLEAAQAKAIELIDAKWAKHRAKTGYMHGFDRTVASAKKLGFEVPPDLQQRYDESAAKSKRERIAKLEAELAQAREGV